MLLGGASSRRGLLCLEKPCHSATRPEQSKARFFACFQRLSTTASTAAAVESQDVASAIQLTGNTSSSQTSNLIHEWRPEASELIEKIKRIPHSDSKGRTKSIKWRHSASAGQENVTNDRSHWRARDSNKDVATHLSDSDIVTMRRILAKVNKKSASRDAYLDSSEALALQRIVGRHESTKRGAVVTSYLTNSEILALRQILDSALEDVQKEKTLFAKSSLRKKRQFNRDYLLEKGPLSYDWRIPFGHLRQHAKFLDSDGNPPPEPEAHDDGVLLSKAKRTAVMYRSVSVDHILMPKVMTQETLTKYVYELVSSRVPTIHSHQIYGYDTDHRNAVRDKLMGLFDLPELIPLLNRPAFHVAMTFLHQNSFVSDSRHLFFLMADLRISPSRETYHIMLRDIAAKKNTHAFAMLLDIMVKRNVISDASTWQSFLKCIESRLVKMLIVDHMRSLNLLNNPRVIQVVTTDLIGIDMENHLEMGGRVSEVIADYDQKYGEYWFCTASANKMFHILGQSGRLKEASDLLEFMTAREIKPDLVTFQTLLQEMRSLGKGGDIYGAMEVVRLTQSHGFELDASMFELLFMMGLNLYRPNWCRAVWQVACLKGEATQKMSVKVMKFLTFSVLPEEQSTVTRWPHFVRFGSRIFTGVGSTADDDARTAELKALADLDSGSIDLTDAARSIRNSDFEKSVNHEFVGDFAQLLHDALELDKQWVQAEQYRQGDLDWMFENAVRVPCSERGSAK